MNKKLKYGFIDRYDGEIDQKHQKVPPVNLEHRKSNNKNVLQWPLK